MKSENDENKIDAFMSSRVKFRMVIKLHRYVRLNATIARIDQFFFFSKIWKTFNIAELIETCNVKQ